MKFISTINPVVYLFVLFTLVGLPQSTQARTFKNPYITFEMPDTWRCVSEQTEYVCRSEDVVKSKEAIIILTAKQIGPEDKFEIYANHLKNPIPLMQKNGTSIPSKVSVPPSEKTIAGQRWLDALHANSEVPNYFTRYLATIKDGVAILITFSAFNQKYSEYASQFIETANSLKVIATKDLLARPESGPLRGSNESLGSSIGGAMPADLLTADDSVAVKKKKSGPLDNPMFLGLLGVLAAIAGYVGFRIYKKKN